MFSPHTRPLGSRALSERSGKVRQVGGAVYSTAGFVRGALLFEFGAGALWFCFLFSLVLTHARVLPPDRPVPTVREREPVRRLHSLLRWREPASV